MSSCLVGSNQKIGFRCIRLVEVAGNDRSGFVQLTNAEIGRCQSIRCFPIIWLGQIDLLQFGGTLLQPVQAQEADDQQLASTQI